MYNNQEVVDEEKKPELVSKKEIISDRQAVIEEQHLMLVQSLESLWTIKKQIKNNITEIHQHVDHFEGCKNRAQGSANVAKDGMDIIISEIRAIAIRQGTIHGELNALIMELDRIKELPHEAEHIKDLKSAISLLKERQAKHEDIQGQLGKLSMPSITALELLIDTYLIHKMEVNNAEGHLSHLTTIKQKLENSSREITVHINMLTESINKLEQQYPQFKFEQAIEESEAEKDSQSYQWNAAVNFFKTTDTSKTDDSKQERMEEEQRNTQTKIGAINYYG